VAASFGKPTLRQLLTCVPGVTISARDGRGYGCAVETYKPLLASKQLMTDIKEIEDSTASTNAKADRPVCFVIMPISDVSGYEVGHFGRVYEHLLRPAITAAGFAPVRSDDTSKTDYIVVGIVQQVVESAMVLCDFSARNPNVLYELGIRHAFNRPVVLIRDTRTDKVFDIQGLRYTEYDASLRIDSVHKDIVKISSAIRETAKPGDSSFNSVVHLAGIQAAVVPQKQEVSPDTQLLLRALSSLESRVVSLGAGSNAKPISFSVREDGVLFSNGETARVGDDIYESNEPGSVNDVGKLFGIEPATQKILIKDKTGNTFTFSPSSFRALGFTTIPF
jgi:hypothetical protein